MVIPCTYVQTAIIINNNGKITINLYLLMIVIIFDTNITLNLTYKRKYYCLFWIIFYEIFAEECQWGKKEVSISIPYPVSCVPRW
jgi:hypothetical protein